MSPVPPVPRLAAALVVVALLLVQACVAQVYGERYVNWRYRVLIKGGDCVAYAWASSTGVAQFSLTKLSGSGGLRYVFAIFPRARRGWPIAAV